MEALQENSQQDGRENKIVAGVSRFYQMIFTIIIIKKRIFKDSSTWPGAACFGPPLDIQSGSV